MTLLDDMDKQSRTDREILEAKNADYASSSDPYQNFRIGESLGICSIEMGIFLRMLDKISRLSKFINGAQYKVDSEKVEDTLSDLRNYAHILESYLKSLDKTKKGV